MDFSIPSSATRIEDGITYPLEDYFDTESLLADLSREVHNPMVNLLDEFPVVDNHYPTYGIIIIFDPPFPKIERDPWGPIDRLPSFMDIPLALIPTVPSSLVEASPTSFNPCAVSIGPLHKTDENLQASERWKTGYMISLMSRIPAPKEEILESCVRKVYALLDQIMACYVSIKGFSIPTIVEMMVVDSCFILEFLLKYWESYKKPNLGRSPLVRTIVHDLLLLENQLPLFVLDEMFRCTILAIDPKASLVELLLPIFSCNNLFQADINIDNVSINGIPHILGLLHHCYRPRVDKVMSGSVILTNVVGTGSQNEWVNFKPHNDSTSYWFARRSWFPNKLTFTMPVVRVDDHTESLLFNFIAYEQYVYKPYASDKHITAYAIGLSMLLKNEEDVAKLADSGVLVNYLGSNGAVVSIFNTILQYKEKWKTSNTYCNGSKIWMMSSYANTTRNVIALLVAIIMFALIVAQTILTIKYGGSSKYLFIYGA
ncbi:hypothetical protein HanOQP8_Chr00c103g0755361 [Helianthus annuus]|nr:hypothetical protein HanOQP8_Chr00c103g0755361 [Helianthus annuus]